MEMISNHDPAQGLQLGVCQLCGRPRHPRQPTCMTGLAGEWWRPCQGVGRDWLEIGLRVRHSSHVPEPTSLSEAFICRNLSLRVGLVLQD